jgi:hypothetical protein
MTIDGRPPAGGGGGRGVERSSDRELLLQQQPFLLFNSVHWEGHIDISIKKEGR